jgi:hypothetical protein
MGGGRGDVCRPESNCRDVDVVASRETTVVVAAQETSRKLAVQGIAASFLVFTVDAMVCGGSPWPRCPSARPS